MLTKKKDENQLTFNQTIEEQVNQKHPLFVLSHTIDWKKFERAFEKHYSKNKGLSCKTNTVNGRIINIKTFTKSK